MTVQTNPQLTRDLRLAARIGVDVPGQRRPAARPAAARGERPGSGRGAEHGGKRSRLRSYIDARSSAAPAATGRRWAWPGRCPLMCCW